MPKPIGIDLGTTMSAMAVVGELGQPSMIRNNKGETLTPSAILFHDDERVVGKPARNAALARPDQVIMFVKRKMDDPKFAWTCDGRPYSAEELSGIILRKLRQDAEEALGEKVTEAVITVPAYFADLERNRTRAAGQIAGLSVIDIINEPTAAAIAYGLNRQQENQRILVYDLGGGTFDVTVMAVTDGSLRVLTSNGHRQLGGVDFDEALATWFAQEFSTRFGSWPLDDRRSYQQFRDEAEKVKIDLSDAEEVSVGLSASGQFLELDVPRAKFESLIGHLIDQTQVLTEKALSDAGLGPGEIDKVLLAGGSTRIPAVRRMVRELVGREPETGINPDEVVALGAAVYAANERGIAVRDTAGRELPPARIRNATAHSLGVVVQDFDGSPRHEKLIPKDSVIPASGQRDFSTVQDNQPFVDIVILQGEDDDPDECIKVGDGGRLDGIPPQPRGVPRISVTLEYDKSGMVHVHARENTSGKEITTTIEYKALLSGPDMQQAMARVEQAKVR